MWQLIGGGIVTVLVALITASATLWGVRRKHSGQIETSEAAALWQESQSIREDQRKENELCQKRLDGLQKQLDKIRQDYYECKETVWKLMGELKQR